MPSEAVPASEKRTLRPLRHPGSSSVADDTTMPRLAASLALLSTAGAMRPSSFWQLKAADLTVGAVVIPTLARRWEDRAAFRAARKRLS